MIDRLACPLCDSEFPPGGRVHHFRRDHPAYWRAFKVRVGSPWIFLALMFGFAAIGVPGWALGGVLAGFIGLSMWARYRSGAERGRRGIGLSAGQWIRGIGIGFALMSIAFVVAALAYFLAG